MNIDNAMHACCLMLAHKGDINFSENEHQKQSLHTVLFVLGELRKRNTVKKCKQLGKDFYCPECRNTVALKDRYCRQCGQAVECL